MWEVTILMLFEMFPELMPWFDSLTWLHDLVFGFWQVLDLLLN